MSGFFRKISPPVVLVLVLAVLPGHAFAVEGDTPPPAPDVSVPDSGNDTFTLSGSDVTVNVEKHDTLSVASVPADAPDGPDGSPHAAGDMEPSTLAGTIRSLFGSYTPRTQTVTTYYDGQPIAVEEQIVPGLAGLDFEWLSGVAIFALVTFCLFRLLGGVLRNG